MSGYDPAAFNTLPSPALAPPPPTISPSDLHNLASPAHSPAPPTPVATQPVYQPAPAQAAAPAPTPVYQPQPAYAPAPQPTYEAAPPQQPVYAAQPAYEAPQGEGPVAIMTKAQQKFAVNLVRTLKKNRSAPPFLRPVDPVALLIPDYLRVVTEPMDIGTIEQKLNSTGKAMTQAQKYGRVFGLDYSGIGEWEGKSPNVYRTADEFREDVDRVWENCFKYNGPKDKNPVSAMAGALQEVSEKLFRTMPFAPAVEVRPLPSRWLLGDQSDAFIPVHPRTAAPAVARDLAQGPSNLLGRRLLLTPVVAAATQLVRPDDPPFRGREPPKTRDPRTRARAPVRADGRRQVAHRASQRQDGPGAAAVLQGGHQGALQEDPRALLLPVLRASQCVATHA